MNEKLKAYKNTKNIQNTDKNPHEIVKYLLENFIICIDNVFTDIETEMDKENSINKKYLIKNKSNNITKMLTIIYSLQVSLDFDKAPDISNNLFQIYEFCRQQILKFIKSQSTEGLIRAKNLINDILQAWSSIPQGSKWMQDIVEKNLIELEEISYKISDLINNSKFEEIPKLDKRRNSIIEVIYKSNTKDYSDRILKLINQNLQNIKDTESHLKKQKLNQNKYLNRILAYKK